MIEVVLATRNQHKVAEFERLFQPFQLTLLPLPLRLELPPEDGETFYANALGKARAASRELMKPVLADDSGLVAAALDGAPGVRSARYAGEHATDAQNLAKLVSEVPPGSPLRFVCALALVDGGLERAFIGECSGTMAPAPRGTNGFGYDPIFIPEAHPDRTMAELSDRDKDHISHRGNAVRDFAWWYLGERLGLRR